MDGTSGTTPEALRNPERYLVYLSLRQYTRPFLSNRHLMLCASELPESEVQYLASGYESARHSEPCSECGRRQGPVWFARLITTTQDWKLLHSCSESCQAPVSSPTTTSLPSKTQEK